MKRELDNFTLWIIFGTLSVMMVIIIVNLIMSIAEFIQVVGR